jgi:PPM family protein phosphatase
MTTLTAVATSTYRACLDKSNDAARCGSRSVLVADGVGSLPYCGEAARFLVQEGVDLLEHAGRIVQLPSHFNKLQERLHALAAPTVQAEELRSESSYASTLLVATDTPSAVGIAYAGNGAIFHLPGDFTCFGNKLALPWTFSNLLRPHSTLNIQGKAALTRHFDASGETVEPTTLWIRKDAQVGDIVVLCTDGIFSTDQVPVGDPGDGTRWQEIPYTLLRLHETLRETFGDPAPLTSKRLHDALQTLLDRLRAEKELDDDATLGILVTEQAAHFHARQGQTG